ncbi:hypothetical protein NM688_g1270 [Phlebia brevispora]|uniref:Uncharacterized protein n=1 Tax=Phlebia brevispora TaxID=194682 RepID=A0ACC1TCP3_9APHY|nr:hypothetical protein NM688_g1270 [Phlebia brevispora]
MSVVLNPSNTLGFHRPLTTHVKRTLAITNPNAQPVAFKVKTTAPKLYCVRPNSGRVEPGETAEVQVMLQAMKEEPPLAAKCKDKFLIQSTLITPEKETLSLQDLWNGETTEDIHSQKIRVAYLPPEGQTVLEEEEEHSRPSIAEQPSQQYTTVAERGQNGHAVPAVPSFSQGTDQQPTHSEEHEVHVDAPTAPLPEVQPPQPEPPVEESPASEQPPCRQRQRTSTNNVDNSRELQAKLQEANAEIKRLRDLISSMPSPSTAPTATLTSATSTELRRRTRAISDDGSTITPETEVGSYVEDGIVHPEGVPLQVVIVIMLGVFIVTYLFF